MKSFLLALSLLVASFAGASGSNTVFRQTDSFWITNNLTKLYENPELSNYLESLDSNILIVKVDTNFWFSVIEDLKLGKIVYIKLGHREQVRFDYNQDLKLIIGTEQNGTVLILSPDTEERCDFDYHVYFAN